MVLKKLGSMIMIALLALAALAQPVAAQGDTNAKHTTSPQFVRRVGPALFLGGKPFRFGGSNNYYPMYKSQFMVDSLFTTAAANNLNVMRVWGFLDIGDPNTPSTSLRGPADGVYFQYWDAAAGAPAYNDGPTGLEHLDYVIAKAGQLGIKLVLPLTNNWNDFGGMDQYVRWRDISTPDDQVWYHDSFYTDPLIRQWYKNWIAHLANRTNSITGVQYKNDPTIMMWDLGNEPRCLSAGAYPRSANCTTQTLISWADEMSTFVKSVDKNHLVDVGDEGFFCKDPNSTDWTENCGEGVDTVAFARLKNIDMMSYHLYPDSWGKDAAWSTDWIKRHVRAAQMVHKPSVLGEYGLRDKNVRNPVYKEWTDTVFREGGDGALYWILSDKQDDGSLYPDFDGFTVYCPSPVCITISNFAKMMAGKAIFFPPVADDDTAVVEFNQPATLNPPANDVTYNHTRLLIRSIDLDPTANGRQTTRTVAGGTFVLQTDGTVAFTPTTGFSGKASIAYTIRDSLLRLSNQANLSVTVKPDPAATILLASYESGTDGAAPAGGTGTVSQSSAFSTNGTSSLEITVTSEGWFRVAALASPVDVSSKTAVKLDLQTLSDQTYRKLSIQVGDSFTWCEQNGGDGNTPQNTVAVISLDLTNMTCSGADLTKLQAINIYLQPGTFRIDSVRAE